MYILKHAAPEGGTFLLTSPLQSRTTVWQSTFPGKVRNSKLLTNN